MDLTEEKLFDELLRQALSNLEMLLIQTHNPMHNNMLKDARSDLKKSIERFKKQNWPGE